MLAEVARGGVGVAVGRVGVNVAPTPGGVRVGVTDCTAAGVAVIEGRGLTPATLGVARGTVADGVTGMAVCVSVGVTRTGSARGDGDGVFP